MTSPDDVVQRFDQAIADVERAAAAEAGALALPWYRPLQRRAALEQAGRAHAHALREARFAGRDFGSTGVGAEHGVWGVLSGGQRFHLEDTLQALRYDRDMSLRAVVEDLLEALPQIRLDAHRGDRRGEARVRDAVLALATRVQEPQTRRRLIEHLPVDDRPRVSSLSELERRGPPVTLFVSDNVQEIRDWLAVDDTLEPRITLHDIVVHRGLAGLGLGTAALRELCRYADEVGMQVVGTMYPGPGYDDLDTRIPRLAAWYARHGFRVGSLPPEQWKAAASIVREPRTT